MRRTHLLVTAAVVVAPAAASADHDVSVRGSRVPVTLHLPDDWSLDAGDDADYVLDDEGDTVGGVSITAGNTCEVMLRAVKDQSNITNVTSTATVPLGWNGFEYDQNGDRVGIYCYAYTIDGLPESVVVLGDVPQLEVLLTEVNRAIKSAEVSASLASSYGSTTTTTYTPPTPEVAVVAQPPTPDVERPAPVPVPPRRRRSPLLPDELAVAAARQTTEAATAWGAGVTIARLPYGPGGLTWSYRGAATFTGEGFAGSAALGVGFAARFASLMVVGGGDGSRDVPFAPHVGGEADLAAPFGYQGALVMSAMVAARDGGVFARLEAKPMIRRGASGYALGVVWERQLDERIWMITLGTMRVPRL